MKLAAVRLSLVLTLCLAAHSQTPVVGGVANAANFSTTVTPGSYISIFGTDLASSIADSDSVPLSTTVNNVSVTFNGIPAPIKYVNPAQINAQLPWNVLSSGTVGTATVVVTNGTKGASAPKTVQIGPFSPGIFAIAGIAVAINPDGSLAAPPNAIPGIATRPAKIGDPGGLIILATGLGAVDSAIANGAASSDKLRNASTTPSVLIGGKPATIVFAGLSPQFPAINQLNIAIPAGTPTGDKISIQISMGGVTTSADVTIAVAN